MPPTMGFRNIAIPLDHRLKTRGFHYRSAVIMLLRGHRGRDVGRGERLRCVSCARRKIFTHTLTPSDTIDFQSLTGSSIHVHGNRYRRFIHSRSSVSICEPSPTIAFLPAGILEPFDISSVAFASPSILLALVIRLLVFLQRPVGRMLISSDHPATLLAA